MPQTQIDPRQNILNYTEIRKTADESVTSSTTIQDDDHLLFSAAANTQYYVEINIFWQTATAPSGSVNNISTQLTGPSGSVGMWRNNLGQAVALGTTTADTSGSNIQYNGGIWRGWVTTAGTPGNIRFRWAQTNSSSNTMTVKAGSVMKVWTMP